MNENTKHVNYDDELRNKMFEIESDVLLTLQEVINAYEEEEILPGCKYADFYKWEKRDAPLIVESLNEANKIWKEYMQFLADKSFANAQMDSFDVVRVEGLYHTRSVTRLLVPISEQTARDIATAKIKHLLLSELSVPYLCVDERALDLFRSGDIDSSLLKKLCYKGKCNEANN
jgi:hypothetical protein